MLKFLVLGMFFAYFCFAQLRKKRFKNDKVQLKPNGTTYVNPNELEF